MPPSPKILVPPIKTQGIKTKLVGWISSLVEQPIPGRWVEPFVGSGVVAFNLKPRRALLADANPHLIAFYRALQSGEITGDVTRTFLQREGQQLLDTEGAHYYAVRERFNEYHRPMDFLFLNRSCFNGMIRFNRKGGFNVPFCRKPRRFAQGYVTKICNQIEAVRACLEQADYEFLHQPFDRTIAGVESDDLVYCDPPYIGRHADYYNGWDEDSERQLATALEMCEAAFILSTWHSNTHRHNPWLKSIWLPYNLLTREHFYHVGGRVENRGPVVEALVSNLSLKTPE